MSQTHVEAADRVFRDDTLEAYQRGVERSIQVMYDRLGEPLSIDNLADSAFMSRFHFTRVFTQITGVSPGRFLAAIRMQEAKRLLLKTDRSVTDISLDVGYNSLGTFTRIFADCIGFSPLRFRQLSLALLSMTIDDVVRSLPTNQSRNRVPSITGEVLCDKPLTLVTVALFPTAIPRSHPLECNCLPDSRRFSFVCRPPKGCRLFGVGVTRAATIEDVLLLGPDRTYVAAADPACAHPLHIDLRLRPHGFFDPPLVLAFPLMLASQSTSKQMSTNGEAGFDS